ncbi:penicillin-binding protein 1B [Amnimonas aquatica]|uniref:Penicillin-binding protein 1B n=2 Tax=Amnimonas aquatica TaxID=2094561 RepID=A0A2P6AV61_9GAMM|nr:penicillin-binding protein 1B [Amnimonas aquatica]
MPAIVRAREAVVPKADSVMQRARTVLVLLSMLAALIVVVAGGAYVMHLDGIVREKFEGKRWAIPARVYARPLVLQAGLPVAPTAVREELALLNYRPVAGAPTPGTYEFQGNTLYLHSRGFAFSDKREQPQLLRLRFSGERIGELASTQPGQGGAVRLEPLAIGGIYPSHNEDRILIQLKEAPPHLVEALLATEDQRFYSHVGISLRGILRAFLVNASAGSVVQGGSTLTQQLVKNFYLTDERSLRRKVNEALMALLLEWHYEKDEILETYLNEVNLGQQGNHSVNGFGLAAQYYFGQPLSELSLPQVALLVGMVKGPSYYNPRRQPARALERRNLVLDNLYREGRISRPERDAAMQLPLGVLERPMAATNLYPDFLDLVRRQLRDSYQAEDLSSQGLKIFTTLDPRAQNAAEAALDSTIARLRKQGRSLDKLEGVVLAADLRNGELRALLGGTGTFTGYNRSIDASRQVGSLLKPAIYLTALSSGQYTWMSPLDDGPVEVVSDAGKVWQPQNYDQQSHGVVPLRTALANSYNQAAVRLGMTVGLPAVINTLRQLGVEGDMKPYPSLLLGALNQTPMDVLQLYQVMLSGVRAPLQSIREVVDAKGNALQRFDGERRQVIDPADAYVLHYGLQQVMRQGTGASAYQRLPAAMVLAGKTGTTNDLRDSWFAGAAGDLLAVVWLGRDDNKPTGLSGGSGALPVWTDLMVRLQPAAAAPAMPPSVAWEWLDADTGRLSNETCSGGVQVPVSAKGRPQEMTACAAGGVPAFIDSVVDGVMNLFRRQ